MCGDTPGPGTARRPRCSVPPCVRGYALVEQFLGTARKGSPVCAGIRPSGTSGTVVTLWFPRVCGDTPLPIPLDSAHFAVPPCVRGYAPDGG